MVKNTVITTILPLQRSTSFKENPPLLYSSVRSCSLPDIFRVSCCPNCCIWTKTCSQQCLLCDAPLEMMNVAQSPCKNCASLTPIEQPHYRNLDILSCDRPLTCASCQRDHAFISLSSIESFSCSVAPRDPLVPTSIRTTASGISTNSYTWKVKHPLIGKPWTCKQCTLLNGPNCNICEACEAPFHSDFNSNFNPSVIIKVCNC